MAVPANVRERAGAQLILASLLAGLEKLRKLWVDGKYTGADFDAWVRQRSPLLDVEVIRRSDDTQGFKILPRRWVVVLTFGWLVQHRCLVRDYEKTECRAAGWIAIALVRIMTRRLT